MANGSAGAWDVDSPTNAEDAGSGASEIRYLREGVGTRMSKEHATLATGGAGGEHVAGSAFSYYETGAEESVPTERPNGDSLTSADNGRLWYRTDTGAIYVYIHSTWTLVKAGDYVANSVLGTDLEESPTIVTPTIADLTNMTHDHADAAGGGRAYPLYMLYEDRENSGVDGGAAVLDGVNWQLFEGWAEVQDEGSDGVLAESDKAITLQAGTYVIRAWHTFFACKAVRIRLYNSSGGGSIELQGGNAYAHGTSSSSVVAHLEGEFTLDEAQNVRLEYRVGTAQATNGLGVKAGFGQELYGAIALWKVAD